MLICLLFIILYADTGKKWFERRKVITPAFHFKILEEYVEIFDRLGNVFVNKVLAKYKPTDEVELYPLAILYALDVMCGEWNNKNNCNCCWLLFWNIYL